jgi:FkbM family methyltransferase
MADLSGTEAEGCNQAAACRHGTLLFNRHDQYIGRCLALYGEYSEDEIRLLAPLLRPGDTVVEAGANIGAHTLPLARAVGAGGRVLAFEPQRLVFQILCANLALNSITQVEARQAAVGAAHGQLRVPPLPPDQTANFGGVSLRADGPGEAVPVLPLDAFDLPACRLLKADVEGMEHAVLAGAQQLVTRCRPVLYVENDRPANSAALIAHLLKLGYRLWWHLPPVCRADNWRGESRDAFPGIVSINLLGLPAEWGANVEGLRPVTDPQDDWRG